MPDLGEIRAGISCAVANVQGELQGKEQQLANLAAENRRRTAYICDGRLSCCRLLRAAFLVGQVNVTATMPFFPLRLRDRVQLLEHNIGQLGEDVRCAQCRCRCTCPAWHRCGYTPSGVLSLLHKASKHMQEGTGQGRLASVAGGAAAPQPAGRQGGASDSGLAVRADRQ